MHVIGQVPTPGTQCPVPTRGQYPEPNGTPTRVETAPLILLFRDSHAWTPSTFPSWVPPTFPSPSSQTRWLLQPEFLHLHHPPSWQVVPCPTAYLSFKTQVQLLIIAFQIVFIPLQPIPCPSSYICAKVTNDLYIAKSNGNSQIAFSAHHSLLLVTIFPKFPWLPAQCSSFGSREIPWRDAAVIHYPPIPRPPGGMRASVLTGGAGQCPPHASNSEGLRPKSFGADHSTSKFFLIVTALVEVLITS